LNIVRSLFVVGRKYDSAILALIDEFVSLVLTFWVNNMSLIGFL
jgi:hypothetical protein